MTEDEKRRVIADLLVRAEVAERNGLSDIANGWLDHACTVQSRPASEMILARPIGEFDISVIAMTGTAAKAVATTAAIESTSGAVVTYRKASK